MSAKNFREWMVAASCLVPFAAYADSATDERQLTEIVVTAQKRTEDIQKIPLSVTAISSEELESRSARDLLDVLRATPGIGISNSVPGQTTIALRGISATSGDATVALYLNDVPLSSGSAGNGEAERHVDRRSRPPGVRSGASGGPSRPPGQSVRS